MLPLNQSKSDDLDLGVMTFHASRSCTERSIIVARHFFSFNFSSPSRISIAAQRLDRPLVQSPNIKQKKERDLICNTQQANSGLVSTTSTTGGCSQVERKATEGVREHVPTSASITRVWPLAFSCSNLMSSVRTVFSGTRKPISVAPKPSHPFFFQNVFSFFQNVFS